MDKQTEKKVDNILYDLDIQIAQLPKALVYYERRKEDIPRLIDRLHALIEDCFRLMAGTHKETREMLLKLIKLVEFEIRQAETIYWALDVGVKRRD